MKSSYQMNETAEFLILGLSDIPEVEAFLFVVFLLIYIITLLGDAYIITLVMLDHRLHNPMYFFLANFSFVDICLTSVIVPQLLTILSSRRKIISFTRCFSQLFFFLFTANMEFFLLAVMGYDRYMAICHPLHYAHQMSRIFCCQLLASSWVITALHALLYTLMTSLLSFCDSHTIHHFFCDIPPLLKLTCSDLSSYQLVTYTEAVSIILGPFVCIVASYVGIILSILRIRSVAGRRKAFSTCSSHLTVVALFYGSVFFMYFRPPGIYALDYDMVVSVVYTVIIPMLNPFIYSLRNKDIKRALSKLLGQRKSGFNL